MAGGMLLRRGTVTEINGRSGVIARVPMVLVVEDEPDIARSVCGMLRDAGYAARVMTTLEEAGAFLHVLRPDCVVLDVTLPDGDAEQLLSQLTRRPLAPPTVLLSATPKARQIAMRFGIPLVAKPFDGDMLLASVHVAIERRTRPYEVAS